MVLGYFIFRFKSWEGLKLLATPCTMETEPLEDPRELPAKYFLQIFKKIIFAFALLVDYKKSIVYELQTLKTIGEAICITWI